MIRSGGSVGSYKRVTYRRHWDTFGASPIETQIARVSRQTSVRGPRLRNPARSIRDNPELSQYGCATSKFPDDVNIHDVLQKAGRTERSQFRRYPRTPKLSRFDSPKDSQSCPNFETGHIGSPRTSFDGLATHQQTQRGLNWNPATSTSFATADNDGLNDCRWRQPTSGVQALMGAAGCELRQYRSEWKSWTELIPGAGKPMPVEALIPVVRHLE